MTPILKQISKRLVQVPIHAYRWTLKPLIGAECRHLPTCSEYGLEAIERNGAWRGLWQTIARISRCRPRGSSGHDPVADLSKIDHPYTPWRYGRWR